MLQIAIGANGPARTGVLQWRRAFGSGSAAAPIPHFRLLRQPKMRRHTA
jgi:hypothetical protein